MKKPDIPAILLAFAGGFLIIMYAAVFFTVPYFLPSVTAPFAAGIIFAVISAFRFMFKNKKWTIFLTNIFMTLGILIFIITQILIFTGVNSNTNEECDYIIVLGCSLYGDIPSRTLKMRLDTAFEYAKRYPDTVIVVSGGQGNDETVPESFAMAKYLIDKGISGERIIQESQSRNTIQNLANTKEILDNINGNDDYSTALVTSGFHIFRSKITAKSLGYKKCLGISAPYPLSTAVFDHVRETASIIVFALKACCGKFTA